jgi:hypothetical protein
MALADASRLQKRPIRRPLAGRTPIQETLNNAVFHPFYSSTAPCILARLEQLTINHQPSSYINFIGLFNNTIFGVNKFGAGVKPIQLLIPYLSIKPLPEYTSTIKEPTII